MRANTENTPGMARTLGLAGITMNAMALIAPGAFLWLTFQLQAAQVDAGGRSTAPDMWMGLLVALVVAFLTAMAFSELARRYPSAGSGGAYSFAERAFLEREEPGHEKWARVAKFVTGWASHLFYWVYPGVMVAFMATLFSYLIAQFSPSAVVTLPLKIAVAWMFAAFVGYIAARGITGSTTVSIVINIVQLTALIAFSALAIWFRTSNPLGVAPGDWLHPSAGSVVSVHSISGVLFQSTLAIVILVGFESAAAYGSEAINPRRDIPQAIILSLIIQGVVAYLFEYFAANYAMGEWLTAAQSTARGIGAAAASRAPIGDMAVIIGDALLGNNGFALMIALALTVMIALLGTTLSAMNTGVRISFAMAQDEEMPAAMGFLHGQFATPYVGIMLMVLVAGLLGSIGVVGGVVALTGITLASNLGTFVLYALVCGFTLLAFVGREGFRLVRHGIVPGLGLILNTIMIVAIFVIGLRSGPVSVKATLFAIGIALVWLAVSAAYFFRQREPAGDGARD